MSLPDYVISASALICERVLVEADGVMSAIRIVDIFEANFPDSLPEEFRRVKLYVCMTIKANPEHNADHKVQLRMIDTTGELVDLGDPITHDFKKRIEA